MPRFDAGSDGALRVPGLYRALRAREREHLERHERFVAHMKERYGCFPWLGKQGRNRALVERLEAGQSVVLRGFDLGGRGLPRVPLLREQSSDYFRVSLDDSVVPAEGREDDAAAGSS